MIAWFKLHPEFLRSEVESLAKNGNYRQLFICRERLLVSHGNILVRLNGIQRYPVLIVYPEATPYELPVIYLLKDILSEDFVQHLSKGTMRDASIQLKPHLKLYYHLRHQNSSGALCTIEWDNFEEGANYLGISTLLQRLRDWHAGLTTGRFPPDSQEVEILGHFNDVDQEYKLIYPISFLDPKFQAGEAYALLYSILPRLDGEDGERRVYFGCLLVGEGPGGIVDSIPADVPGLFMEEGISGPQELYTNQSRLTQLLESGKWLSCVWVHIDTAPSPFKTFKELVEIIGNGNYEDGLNVFGRFYERLKLKPVEFFLGLRFPNRRGDLEFQLFRVFKNEAEMATLFMASVSEQMDNFVQSYTRVAAVESEKLTEQTFYLRNHGRINQDMLRRKIVAIIGAGALGSEIADSINKAGPGAMLIFDNQVMKAHNAVRHVGGLMDVGVPKVFVLGELLRQHNPFVIHKTFPYDIRHCEIDSMLPDGSIAVSSLADDNTEAYLNEKAVLSGKTIFYTRALRGGKAARIFRVIPGRDACFQCLNLYRQESDQFLEIPPDPELLTLKNECNNPVRPASAADLKLISALSSRLIIDYLNGYPQEDNHWIWTSEPIPNLPNLTPWSIAAQSIPPHPKCLYCIGDNKVIVRIAESALNFARSLVLENPEIETGGVLVGLISEAGVIDIRFASGPGPMAKRSTVRFEKDVVYCQRFLDTHYQENQAVYVGEWHSHPSENNHPSGTDIKSLREIALQDSYLTCNPVMIIFGKNGEAAFTLHPAGKIFRQIYPEIY